MEEHNTSVNMPESNNSCKVDSNKVYKYKKEIDEIMREESECGLAKTMSPDQHLIANGSEVTYSQLKKDTKERNLKGKTSTLNVDTQELSNDISLLVTTGKQLGTLNTYNESHRPTRVLKRYTPKSINYIKRILEATKTIMSDEVSSDDIICEFDSSETKSGIEENGKETDTNENDDVKYLNQQTKNLQHVRVSGPHISSSDTSVISNSSKSDENRKCNNKRSVKDETRVVKRKCSGLKASHSHVEGSVESNCLDKIQCQTVCVTVNMNKPVQESSKLSPLKVPNNFETNENFKKFKNVSMTEGNSTSVYGDKRLELVPKAGSSQVNNDNNFSNKTSELSEICPRVSAKILTPPTKTLHSCVNPMSVASDIVTDAASNERELSSNENSVKLAEKSDKIGVMGSKTPAGIESKNSCVTNIDDKSSKVPTASKKKMKYKVLKNIFKLMLKSPIKDTVTEFIASDSEIQTLLKGWKLKVNAETGPTSVVYSKNICHLCRNCEEREVGNRENNLQKDYVTLCIKATQTELSSTRHKDQCVNRAKWINESCSESEVDFDLNSLI